jgi:hypothetical protein
LLDLNLCTLQPEVSDIFRELPGYGVNFTFRDLFL